MRFLLLLVFLQPWFFSRATIYFGKSAWPSVWHIILTRTIVAYYYTRRVSICIGNESEKLHTKTFKTYFYHILPSLIKVGCKRINLKLILYYGIHTYNSRKKTYLKSVDIFGPERINMIPPHTRYPGLLFLIFKGPGVFTRVFKEATKSDQHI